MNNFRLLFALLLFVLFIQSNAKEPLKVAGNWSGKLDLPNTKLEIIFKISQDSTGKLMAQMNVPQQGAKDLLVNEIQVTNDSLILKIAMIYGQLKAFLKTIPL